MKRARDKVTLEWALATYGTASSAPRTASSWSGGWDGQMMGIGRRVDGMGQDDVWRWDLYLRSLGTVGLRIDDGNSRMLISCRAAAGRLYLAIFGGIDWSIASSVQRPLLYFSDFNVPYFFFSFQSYMPEWMGWYEHG